MAHHLMALPFDDINPMIECVNCESGIIFSEALHISKNENKTFGQLFRDLFGECKSNENHFIKNQKPLGDEFQKVLWDNYSGLIDES